VAQITPPVIRSTVTDDEFGGFRITIPAPVRGRYACGCALAVWPVLAALALFYTVSDPDHTAADGLKFLLFWAVVGLLLVSGLVYAMTWRSVLMIEGKTLVLRSEFAGLSRARAFDLADVRNLRPTRLGDRRVGIENQPCALAFDHGGRTHHFGVGLSEYEVNRLVKTIRTRYRIPDDWDDVEPLPVIT
jgi:hypothetical protein